MTGSPYILLPPSEGKAEGGTKTKRIGSFDDALGPKRQKVLEALASIIDVGDERLTSRTLNARGAIALRAVSSLREMVLGDPVLLPAWRRFNGVVWTNLDPRTLEASQRRRILVPSGMYGLSCATDLVADFRLKMNVNLAPMGNLARYWRPEVSEVLAQRLNRSTVVNLLPKEHAASIDWERIRAVSKLFDVSFVTRDGAQSVGHDAKAVKGVLARELLTNGVGILEDFRWRGWISRPNGGLVEILSPQ